MANPVAFSTIKLGMVEQQKLMDLIIGNIHDYGYETYLCHWNLASFTTPT